MDLVINDDGDVVLKEGKAEVSEGSTLVIIKEDTDPSKPDTKIEITNNDDTDGGLTVDKDGNVTADEGTSFDVVTTDKNGNTKTESYVSKSDNTEIKSTENGNELTSGSVELKKGSDINIEEDGKNYNISNSGSNGDVTAEIGTDGKINIDVTPGGTVTVDNENENIPDLSFTNSKDNTGNVQYEVNEDGSIKANAGDSITSTLDGKNTVINPQGDTEITVTPTENGLDISVPNSGEIKITEEIAPGKRVTSVITAESDDVELTSTENGTKLNEGTVSVGDNGSVIVGDTKIGNKGGSGVEITAPDEYGQGGKIVLSENGSVSIDKPGTTGGGYTFSVPKDEGSGDVTLDMTPDGGIKVPLDTPVTISTGTGAPHTISTTGSQGDGLVFEPTENGPKLQVGPGETLVIDGKEYKNTDPSNPSIINLTNDGKVVVLGGECKVPAGETVYMEKTDASGNKQLVDITVPKVTPNPGETVTGGDVSVSVSAGGDISTKVTPQIVRDESGAETVVDASLEIGGATYVAKNANGSKNDLHISTDPDTGEVTLYPDSTGSFEVTNGNLTIGNDTFSSDGDTPVVINRTSTVTTPTVTVPAGGNITIGDKSKGKEMEIDVPKDSSGDVNVSIDKNAGTILTTLGKDSSITIGGVEYTSKDGGKIYVDAVTGKLDTAKSNANPDMKIDPSKFNKENYEVEVGEGQTITVGNTTYTSEDGTIKLTGNPDGNPVINVAGSGETVKIGEKTYTTANDGTSFSVADNGNITLENDNSSLAFNDAGTYVVDGVKYTSGGGDMTIGKQSGKTVLDTKDGTDVTVVVPKGESVVVKSNGASDVTIDGGTTGKEIKVKTSVDENGNKVLVTDEIKKPVNVPEDDDDDDDDDIPAPVAETAVEPKETTPVRRSTVTEVLPTQRESSEIQYVETADFDTLVLKGTEVERNEVHIDLGEGSISLYVVSDTVNNEEKSPAILEGKVADIISYCLTEEEIQSVADGASVEIRLTVEKDNGGDVVSEDERAAIKEAVDRYNQAGRDYVIGVYTDITLSKNINGEGWSAIHEANGKLRIVLEIPKEILSDNRTYYVIRKHGNEYEVLTDVDVVGNTITFLSDRFSTYAVLYTENASNEKKPLAVEKPTIEPVSGNDVETPVTPDEHCHFPWWIIIVILLLIAGGYTYYRKKKNSDNESDV